MVKIFQIGFNITGTRSLAYFFRKNNFKDFHWENRKLAEQLFANLDTQRKITHFNGKFEGPFPSKQGAFYSDMEKVISREERLGHGDIFFKWEAYKLFKELDNYYNNIYFILNLRNDWIKRKIEKNKEKGKEGFYTEKELREFLEKNYNEHIKNVREYFKGRDDFIEFNIQDENIHKVAEWLRGHGFKIKKEVLPKIKG